MKTEKNYGFLAKAKITGANLPQYKGVITIDGTEYEIAAWIKESKKGEQYLSLSATEKDEEYVKPVKKEDAPKNGFLPF
jgi:hypothetical protein